MLMMQFVKESLQTSKRKNLYRSLISIEERRGCEIVIGGKTFIDFSSNDYLGLSDHSLLKQRAIEYVKKMGVGNRSSRLVSGNVSCFATLEKKIARFKHTQAALLFNSGYQANLTLIPALANRFSLLLVDRLAHNSILQGALLSRARMIRYPHNDLHYVEKLVQKYASSSRPILVLTESVFSMEGDLLDLEHLSFLAKKYPIVTYVDEAHATGVFGKEGRGLTIGYPIDLVMGTFSKAMGSFGAYVATSTLLRNYLINFCSGIIYSTALPPPVLGSIDAALDLVLTLEDKRKQLLQMSQEVRHKLSEQGWQLTKTTSPIIPVIVGEAKKALLLYQKLLRKKIFAIPIRPPTVAEGEARIRFSLSARHGKKEIHHLLQTLALLVEDFR